MGRLIFIVWGIFFLLLYSSCEEELIRTVKVYNDIDTPLVFMAKNYPTNEVDYSCGWGYPLYRIEPGGAVEYTVGLNYYDRSFIF